MVAVNFGWLLHGCCSFLETVGWLLLIHGCLLLISKDATSEMLDNAKKKSRLPIAF